MVGNPPIPEPMLQPIRAASSSLSAVEPVYSLVVTGVSELKQMQLQLEQRAQKLEELNEELLMHDRAKDSFLSNVSHELRTPLNAISGYSQLLLEGLHGLINEKQQKDLGIIRSSCDHLLGLITDILEVSKIESGQSVRRGAIMGKPLIF